MAAPETRRASGRVCQFYPIGTYSLIGLTTASFSPTVDGIVYGAKQTHNKKLSQLRSYFILLLLNCQHPLACQAHESCKQNKHRSRPRLNTGWTNTANHPSSISVQHLFISLALVFHRELFAIALREHEQRRDNRNPRGADEQRAKRRKPPAKRQLSKLPDCKGVSKCL